MDKRVILSIHDGHNASVAVIYDGRVLFCVSEERLNREKFFWGFPKKSIELALKECNLSLNDIDVVTVSHLNTLGYIKRKFELQFYKDTKNLLGHIYNIFQVFDREQNVKRLFKSIKHKPKFYFCDHHIAHAASAYYFSGFDESLVVAIDALGDSLSHTAYHVKNNKWKKITSGNSGESLGEFYLSATKALGFIPNRHEGKVVGLAAYGNYQNLTKENGLEEYFISITKDKLHFKRNKKDKIISKIKELLDKGYKKEDIASYVQYLLEEVVVSHIQYLCDITKSKNLALAGGVFANVKLNQRIAERCSVKNIFIQPAMGDEGLVLGSSFYFLNQYSKEKKSCKLEDVYTGPSYDDEYIKNVLIKGKYEFQEEKKDVILREVVKNIKEDKIIGWFNGKMEFGPRALGNRSVLANPMNKDINNILNKRLNRSEFMPFAPSVLYEFADDIFENVSSSIHSGEFMTITYYVKDKWRNKVPAIVHVDNTARPQFVRRNVNKDYYDLIKSFYKITGIPLVINTSFNLHEEPIVCSPEDALRSFNEGAVDYLVFNSKFIVYGKR